MTTELPNLDPTNPLSVHLARITGDQMAMFAAIHALIAIHPQPEAWAGALDQQLDRLQGHWAQFPDAGQYQAENRIEDWCTALRSRSTP